MEKMISIKMTLLSDAIFCNGSTLGEDVSVPYDEHGFPYYKGRAFAGILREAFERYLIGNGRRREEIQKSCTRLFGSGHTRGNIFITDFTLSDMVKMAALEALGDDSMVIFDSFTHIRSFVKVNKAVSVRFVNKGLEFYGSIICQDCDLEMVRETLSLIEWSGAGRTRGYGRVRIDCYKID